MLNIEQDQVQLNQAMALRGQGALQQAEAIVQAVLQRSPRQAGALQLAGILRVERGDLAGGVAFLQQAMAAAPTNAEIPVNLGLILRQASELEGAVNAHREALRRMPDSPVVWMHLGVSLAMARELAESKEWLEKAAAAFPREPEVLQNLATLYVDMHEFEQAIQYARRALEIDPKRAMLWVVLQKAYSGLGRFSEADEAVGRAMALASTGEIYKAAVHSKVQAGKSHEALENSAIAVQKDPSNPIFHFDRATILLTLGQFEEGWREYEARRLMPELRRAAPNVKGREWNGEPLDGKRIVLYVEQGFGDAIHFVRYAPLVAKRGGRVVISCQKELKRLLTRVEGVEQCVAESEPWPEYELSCPLLSLARIFGTTEKTIPASTPYLSADPADVARWREKLSGGKFKIGLSWAGRPTHLGDRLRSIRAADLAAMVRDSGAQFYSLQKGLSAEAVRPLVEAGMIDLTADIRDFADTAGLVANLDLVITVDTAIAHLAGAMNEPTWVFVPLAPDWRWQMNREDSPWYPSMRLFRQTSFNDWPSVIARVRGELQKLAKR